MHRNLAALVLLHESLGLVVGVVAGVALGRDRQIDHRLAQRQLALGRTQAFIGQRRVVGDLHGARIGQAYVFPGHAHDAAREIACIGATVEHARQPIERRVGVRAAH
ncbi:hypothetical protein D3C86_1778670 [compost metagenome]